MFLANIPLTMDTAAKDAPKVGITCQRFRIIGTTNEGLQFINYLLFHLKIRNDFPSGGPCLLATVGSIA